ncbi:MAG: hypothetical protein M1818_005635 [Claussenomyces sp. TS43310]|nr:MAG: hypothetical protein M1818_005635 [Claussenomyces sp. TS43310]
MPFKLVEIDAAADFDQLIECEWISYENPLQNFFRLFCPLRGTGPTARKESLREATSRQLEWHESDPTSYWQKVINEEGKIAAGALWKICPTNPFEHQDEHSEAYWFPEGSQRNFVTKALEIFDAPRSRMAQRPQLYLNIIFTHPDYRRKGAADLIMEWGIQKAESMGVEMWLDATIYGIPLYKKYGFVVVHENAISPIDNADEEWRRIAEDLGPMTMWQMWRPVGGNYEEGKTIRPWEGSE